jgi:hypothetical protein
MDFMATIVRLRLPSRAENWDVRPIAAVQFIDKVAAKLTYPNGPCLLKTYAKI